MIINRRVFFEIAGAGVAGYFVSPMETFAQNGGTTTNPNAVVLNKARNVIFILLPGAPSHTDTFDLKVGPWTPAAFAPTTMDGVDFPASLFPTLASQWSTCFGAQLSIDGWFIHCSRPESDCANQ
jgi:hypothetical protein